MKLILVFTFAILVLGCDQKGSIDSTKERAKAEGEANKEVENNNLSQKAQKMEQDLRKRNRLYQGIAHKYVGRFEISGNLYTLQMIFAPTLFVFDTDRVRTFEEIQDDLNNLYLSAQIVVWDEKSGISAGDCTFDKVRPDITTGRANLISSECELRLALTLTVPKTKASDRNGISILLANSLLSGEEDTIDYIHASVNSKFRPDGYEVLTERVK